MRGRAEGRGQRAEGRGQRAEGRGQRAGQERAGHGRAGQGRAGQRGTKNVLTNPFLSAVAWSIQLGQGMDLLTVFSWFDDWVYPSSHFVTHMFCRTLIRNGFDNRILVV